MKKAIQVLSMLFIFTGFIYSQGITMIIGSKTAQPGSSVSVPINVTNFNDIGAISLQIRYNSSALSYTGVENQPAGNFTQNSNDSIITIGWFSTTAMNLGNGKLLDLKFNYIGGTGNLSFKTSGCEIANSGTSILTILYTGGSVKPAFEGTFYIGPAGTKPGGGDPEYATLKSAVTALNAATLTGDVTFLITGNLDEADHSGIGLDTKGFTVTFKPAPAVSPVITFTKTTDNAGVSGGLVIGAPDLTITSATNYGLIPTRNIVVDGSNLPDGTSRDLTIRTSATSNGNTNPIRLIGDVNNIVIKNVVVLSQQSVSYTLSVTNRFYNNTNFTPDSITIENCDVTNTVSAAGQAIAFSNIGNVTAYNQGSIIKNNKIRASTRGIFINYCGNINLSANHITVKQPGSDIFSHGIMIFNEAPGSVVNIDGNLFSELSTANKMAGEWGINGIFIITPATYNITNNMITGFASTTAAANPSSQFNGIYITANATANIYNNSFYLPELNFSAGTGLLKYRAIAVTNGTIDLKNNNIVLADNDTSFCIHKSGTGTLKSNYNNLYSYMPAGAIGNGPSYAILALDEWKNVMNIDSNSISVIPGYVSATDLHLANSQSPVIGKGVNIPIITTDIDGDTRDNIPEIGADEIPGVVPVELASFNVTADGNSVTLSWRTVTEVNNSRFEIERKLDNQNWNTIGSVNGKGTTSEVTAYSFADQVSGYTKLSYRLKQVDLDGTFSYSKVIELSGSESSMDYELSQNYPNPFNPTTKISYSLPIDSRVILSVYTITGELVKELVNADQSAGTHTVEFNASELSNGIYIYKIQAGNFAQSRKMILVK